MFDRTARSQHASLEEATASLCEVHGRFLPGRPQGPLDGAMRFTKGTTAVVMFSCLFFVSSSFFFLFNTELWEMSHNNKLERKEKERLR